MKYVIIFLLLLPLKLCNKIYNQPIDHKMEIKNETLEEEALKYYTRAAKNLYGHGDLKIHWETFAKWCVIVAWCESNLDTKAKNGSQQGICQFTKRTRRYLDIPDNILDQKLARQVYYHYLYLTECSPRLLSQLKSPEDLHMLNFKPFGKRSSKVTKNTKALDFNKDGYITPNDLRIFQQKRIKENTVIEQMYKSLNG